MVLEFVNCTLFCSSAVDYSKILTKSNSVQRPAEEVNMIPNIIVSSNKLILDYIEKKLSSYFNKFQK